MFKYDLVIYLRLKDGSAIGLSCIRELPFPPPWGQEFTILWPGGDGEDSFKACYYNTDDGSVVCESWSDLSQFKDDTIQKTKEAYVEMGFEAI